MSTFFVWFSLLERVLLIVVESRLGQKTPLEKVIWNTMFEAMLEKNV